MYAHIQIANGEKSVQQGEHDYQVALQEVSSLCPSYEFSSWILLFLELPKWSVIEIVFKLKTCNGILAGRKSTGTYKDDKLWDDKLLDEKLWVLRFVNLTISLQISNHKRQSEQLRSDLQLTKSSHSEEVGRYQQDIQLLKEDLELTKNDLEEAQSQASEFKLTAASAQEALEKERQLHEEAVSEVNRRGDELQTQDRQWSECRQQVIILEGQLEQSHENINRLENSLDNYKQKFQTGTEQIGQLEDTLTKTQEQLAESRNRVSTLIDWFTG